MPQAAVQDRYGQYLYDSLLEVLQAIYREGVDSTLQLHPVRVHIG